MRISKVCISILTIVVCFLFIVPAFAEIKVFEREESAVVGEDQSKNQVESMLQEKAKLAALEEAGTYIATLTVVQNYQLQKDEVTALAAGVLSTKKMGIASYETIDGGRNVKIKVKFRVEVDSSVLDKRIEAFMKDRGALKKEEEYIRKIKELEKQLASLKSSELKRLEELNAQAIALERARDKQRLFREEQALKARGELSKAEAERIAKEREMQERINRTLADQERAKREEAAALAAEQDRIRRAALENEQRWNELSRKAKLSQESWVAIDDSLSLKQAIEEVNDLKREIWNLRERLYYQYYDNIRNLKDAYKSQRALTTLKLLQLSEPAPKDVFESTREYNERISPYERQKKNAVKENAEEVEKLEKEENLKLTESKLVLLQQQIRVLAPFIDRLKKLQAQKFTLPEGGAMTVELRNPDADNNRFPIILRYNGKSWTEWWNYTDRNRARDFYRTKTYLKAEGLFQIEETANLRPKLTAARVTHLATQETKEFLLEKPRIFSEINQFGKLKKEEATAEERKKKASFLLTHKEIGNDGRFIAYDDGTVLDTETNLMWAARDNGSNINWWNAKSYCENYRGGGYTDWRMPTQDELEGLYDRAVRGKVTTLITLTTCYPWAFKTGRGDGAYINFNHHGEQYWTHQSSYGGYRALPVRSAK